MPAPFLSPVNDAAVTLRRLPVTLMLTQLAAGKRHKQDFQDSRIGRIETIWGRALLILTIHKSGKS